MRDFARLNVYIADSNVLKTEESEDYTESQLLSDIGGQLGLWVGISVITLAEMFELITDVIRYLFKSKGPTSKGKNFSRDPEYGQQRDVNHATARDYENNHVMTLNRRATSSLCDNHVCNGALPLTALHRQESERLHKSDMTSHPSKLHSTSNGARKPSSFFGAAWTFQPTAPDIELYYT